MHHSIYVRLFLPLALSFSLLAGGSILDRWWICTIVEELCVALREEFRYSSVGRSVGRLVVVCVWGHSVSHGVYPLWAARLSSRPCMRSFGG